jgi:hypothetical protein
MNLQKEPTKPGRLGKVRARVQRNLSAFWPNAAGALPHREQNASIVRKCASIIALTRRARGVPDMNKK